MFCDLVSSLPCSSFDSDRRGCFLSPDRDVPCTYEDSSCFSVLSECASFTGNSAKCTATAHCKETMTEGGYICENMTHANVVLDSTCINYRDAFDCVHTSAGECQWWQDKAVCTPRFYYTCRQPPYNQTSSACNAVPGCAWIDEGVGCIGISEQGILCPGMMTSETCGVATDCTWDGTIGVCLPREPSSNLLLDAGVARFCRTRFETDLTATCDSDLTNPDCMLHCGEEELHQFCSNVSWVSNSTAAEYLCDLNVTAGLCEPLAEGPCTLSFSSICEWDTGQGLCTMEGRLAQVANTSDTNTTNTTTADIDVEEVLRESTAGYYLAASVLVAMIFFMVVGLILIGVQPRYHSNVQMSNTQAWYDA